MPVALALLCLQVHPAAAEPEAKPELEAKPEAELEADVFPSPEALRPAIAFWKRVYLEVTTSGGLIHDSRHLGVVYEVVRLDSTNPRRRETEVKRRKHRWRDALRHLASGKAPSEDRQHRAARALEAALGHAPSTREYARASRRIRFQLGQRDEFRAGLIRSGAFDAAMRAVLLEEGVPEGLIALPYVESSFNLSAYSKYGAAGPWQFMRSTGRRFLKIDYVVDERLDPIVATRAAARLLRKNYESLASWPLAITAYNHGRAGMARAVRRLGTRDIERIIEEYRSRSFGFASRNFYVQFLAASEILQIHESYFGPLMRDEPRLVDEVTLPYYTELADLQDLGVSLELVKQLNPSLRPPVFRGLKRIPRNFKLKLPAGSVGEDPDAWLARVPESGRYSSQTRSRYYRVRGGDTLGKIARRNRTTVSALVSQNSLRSRHRIRKGQVLEIPSPGRNARPGSPKAPKASPPAAETRDAERGLWPGSPPTRQTAEAQPEPEFLGPWLALEPISDDVYWHRLLGNSTAVGPLETLGHFADWLGVATQRLRQLNHLKGRDLLKLGQRIELDFSRTPEQVFRQRRLQYHKGIEEDFFESFVITGTIEHRLQIGDNLWDLSRETYSVPIWLIQRYNPEIDLSQLVPGRKLSVPVIEPAGRAS